MSRTTRRPAQVWDVVPITCGAAVICLAAACSDPSAGPHLQSPASTASAAARTFVVAPDGQIEAAGTAGAPIGLSRAVAMAPAGSTLELAGGTYQTTGLTIDRPLTIKAAQGATVELKASTAIPASQWEPAGRMWRTPWTSATLAAVAAGTKPSPSAPAVAAQQVAVRQDRLTMDGKLLTAAASQAAVSAGSFFIDTAEKWLYVGQDPSIHAVQTGGADVGVLVKAPNVTLIGIGVHAFQSIGLRVASQYATISASDFSWNGLIGLDINGADHLTVQNSSMTYNGQVGIELSHSSNITIQSDNISNNNTGNYDVDQEAAGVKGTDVTDVVVRDNWVADNASNAIWFDVNSVNITIAGNQALRNKCYAIYFELNNAPLIVGNLVYDNVQAGIGVHFTTNAEIYNNTLVNNGTNLDVSASYDRSPYDTYGAVIANNIIWNGTGKVLVNLYRYNGCSSWVYKQVDYDAYYRSNSGTPGDVVNWCNDWYTNIKSFHSGTGNEAHGIEYDGGSDPYFVNAGGGDYHLRSGSPAIGRGEALPGNAAAALGVSPGVAVSMGALQH
jgi:mannuronan 5-epimerase